MISRDVRRHVFGPSVGDVEGDDADRVVILAGNQIGDRGFHIGPIFAGLAIGPAQLTEIIEHEIDGLIAAVWRNQREAPGICKLPTRPTGEIKHEKGKHSCQKVEPSTLVCHGSKIAYWVSNIAQAAVPFSDQDGYSAQERRPRWTVSSMRKTLSYYGGTSPSSEPTKNPERHNMLLRLLAEEEAKEKKAL